VENRTGFLCFGLGVVVIVDWLRDNPWPRFTLGVSVGLVVLDVMLTKSVGDSVFGNVKGKLTSGFRETGPQPRLVLEEGIGSFHWASASFQQGASVLVSWLVV